MASQEGPLDENKRGQRLPVALGLAIFGCALAFGWLAAVPSDKPHPFPPASAGPRSGGAGADGALPKGGVSGPVTISVMTLGNELRPAQIAEFEALNPDVRVNFLEYSANLLDILLATHDLPDVIRLGQVEHRPLVQRGLLLDITDRIASSKVIAASDMREPWVANLAVDGRFYGLPQGLSTPDFSSIYINTAAFEAAGLPLPSLREPMTYAELASMAQRLSAKSGRPAFYSYFFERAVTAVLAQIGERMFNDDLSEMTLTANPRALEVVRYFYDLGVSGAMHVQPATPSIAFLFENGELPMSQSGYWMGAVVTPATPAYGHVTMLPPPVWDRHSPRVSAHLGGTTLAISAATRRPDPAYRFIEWYVAGKPAAERARQGWGFPLLRSMQPLLPKGTDFDRQRLHVALDSLKLPVVRLPEYPYPGVVPAFNQSWTRNLLLARSGKIGFAEFASNLQQDVNLAIQDDVASRRDEQAW